MNIDTTQRKQCRTRFCKKLGRRAHGAPDIEGFATRTKVIEPSFYCDDCVRAAAQRSLSTSFAMSQRRTMRRNMERFLAGHN